MEKLSEYMAKHLPSVDRQTIKDVLTHYHQWHSTNRTLFCEICDVELTRNNMKIPSQYDFLNVCIKHKEYANSFRADIIRKQLGIKPKEHLNDL